MKKLPRIQFNWGFWDGLSAAERRASYHSIDSNKVASKDYKAGWRAGFNHFKDVGAGNVRPDTDSQKHWQEYKGMNKNPRRRTTTRGRTSVSAALAVLKATEAAHYKRPRRAYVSGRKVKLGPEGSLTGGHRARITKGSDPRNIKRRLRKMGFRVNPATKKHIHLQEKRGAQWVTLAMFPDNPKGKALCRTVGKRLHMKYPSRTYRAFS